MTDSIGAERRAQADRTPLAPEDLPGLIKIAYDEAKRSGRPDWNVMTTAVLKNRLLTITNRAFNERHYGASTMAEFARMFPELLDVDDRPKQAVVTLRGTEADKDAMQDQNVPSDSAPRVRPDLWRAIIDFSHGRRYVWDAELNRARVARPEDRSLTLPTTTPEIVHSWRTAFAESLPATTPPNQIASVERWRDEDLGAAFLPYEIRGQWNGYTRDRVLEILEEFFEDADLPVPEDLVGTLKVRAQPAPDKVSDLRAFLHLCLDMMSPDELRQLPISADAAFRAAERRSR